jgi:hypothetical protein
MSYAIDKIMTLELSNKFKNDMITLDKRELEIMLEDAYICGQGEGPNEDEDT